MGTATLTRAAQPPGADAAAILRKIPSSGEELPIIGLGTSGPFEVDASEEKRAPLREVLAAFFAAGGRLIDTSPMYSSAEGVLGDLLTPQMHERAFLATKVWTRGERSGIEQMTHSAQLLKSQRLDLIQVHNLLDLEMQLKTLRAWKEAGRVRYLGVTHYTVGAHAESMTRAAVAAIIASRERSEIVTEPFEVITVDTDLNADGLMPDSDPNVHNFGPASSGRSQQQEDITAYIQLAVRSPLAPPATGDAARGRTIFAGGANGANCVACHSGGKWTVSRVTYDPADVNPVPGTQTGIVNIPPADLDQNGTIDETESKAISVYLNGFNSTAGAGRVCEVPPPPGNNTERIRIVHQVGTFTAANPIEARSNALSPVNTPAPALTVAGAFGGVAADPVLIRALVLMPVEIRRG